MSDRYIAPRGRDRAFNGFAAWLTGLGFSVAGSRILAVRGRRSGEWRTTVVNLLDHGGDRYLVAPRGNTDWVRNLRVAGTGELRLGRKVEAFAATEMSDTDKLPVLRAYLDRWGWEVGQFFEGVTKDASDRQLNEIAPGFPVFRLASAKAET